MDFKKSIHKCNSYTEVFRSDISKPGELRAARWIDKRYRGNAWRSRSRVSRELATGVTAGCGLRAPWSPEAGSARGMQRTRPARLIDTPCPHHAGTRTPPPTVPIAFSLHTPPPADDTPLFKRIDDDFFWFLFRHRNLFSGAKLRQSQWKERWLGTLLSPAKSNSD